jgi:hypothetical protein
MILGTCYFLCFYYRHPTLCKVVSQCGLDLNFPLANDAEYISMWILDMCKGSGTYLLRLHVFKFDYATFYFLFFYIFIQAPFQIYYNYFPQSMFIFYLFDIVDSIKDFKFDEFLLFSIWYMVSYQVFVKHECFGLLHYIYIILCCNLLYTFVYSINFTPGINPNDLINLFGYCCI